MKDILDKVDVLLDMNDPNFADQFKEAIGLDDGETLEITTPQFDRVDGTTPGAAPIDFAALPTLDDGALIELGCRRWDEPDSDGNVLWLFPHEWYLQIPDGLPIVDISNNRETFKRGVTDDDMRFGMLAFGFLRPAPPPASR